MLSVRGIGQMVWRLQELTGIFMYCYLPRIHYYQLDRAETDICNSLDCHATSFAEGVTIVDLFTLPGAEAVSLCPHRRQHHA